MEKFDKVFDSYNSPDNKLPPAIIAKTYIQKAKFDMDSVKIARGYERLSRIYDFDLNYADTCIFFTRNSKHDNYPTVCYLLKVIKFSSNQDRKNMLREALKAYEIAKEKKNISYLLLSANYINTIHSNWGNPQTAISGYKKELNTFYSKKSDSLNYGYVRNGRFKLGKIDLIVKITKNYLRLSDLQNAKKYLDSGYQFLEKYNFIETDFHYYYSELEAYNAVYKYKNEQYTEALKSINNYISYNKSINYIGYNGGYIEKALILNKLGDSEKAITLVKYADSLYQIAGGEFEELAEGYKLLVDHYKDIGDKTSQLLYLNKLIKLDSIITSNYITTSAAITKNYTIPELKREKEEAIARLEAKNQQASWGLWALSSGLLLALGIGSYYFITQRQYKNRFKAVVAQSEQLAVKETVVSEPPKTQENPLDPELVQRLDEAIKIFEKEERFTTTKITQKSLAEELNTNSAYLSRYINQYKGKNFAQYLISLRVNYAIQRLQKDKVLRSYTVDAISEECGFGNSKSFTKAFKTATGINPSYFIRNLDKSIN